MGTRKSITKLLGEFLIAILSGSFLRNTFAKHIPMIFYFVFLGIVMIYMRNDAERMARQIKNLNEDIEELRFHFVSNRTELMYEIQQNELARGLNKYGVKESLVPPKVIRIKEEVK